MIKSGMVAWDKKHNHRVFVVKVFSRGLAGIFDLHTKIARIVNITDLQPNPPGPDPAGNDHTLPSFSDEDLTELWKVIIANDFSLNGNEIRYHNSAQELVVEKLMNLQEKCVKPKTITDTAVCVYG